MRHKELHMLEAGENSKCRRTLKGQATSEEAMDEQFFKLDPLSEYFCLNIDQEGRKKGER